MVTIVKNTYTKMYVKYIYFMQSILQIRVRIYVLNKNTLQLYFWYTKLVYLKSAKFMTHSVYRLSCSCSLDHLKSCWRTLK